MCPAPLIRAAGYSAWNAHKDTFARGDAIVFSGLKVFSARCFRIRKTRRAAALKHPMGSASVDMRAHVCLTVFSTSATSTLPQIGLMQQ